MNVQLCCAICCWRDLHRNSFCMFKVCKHITLTAIFLPLSLSLPHFPILSSNFFFRSLHPFCCHIFFLPSMILDYFLSNHDLSSLYSFLTKLFPSLSVPELPSCPSGLVLLCHHARVHHSTTCASVSSCPTQRSCLHHQAAWTVRSWGSSTVHPIAAHPPLAPRPISGGSQVHLVGTGQMFLRAAAVRSHPPHWIALFFGFPTFHSIHFSCTAPECSHFLHR